MANATEAKFGDPVTRIAQTDCWTVLLRPKQPTFGSLVLICREPVQAFAEVSAQGYAELREMVGKVEATLRGLVAYERINYLMLMMVDPDVHFHVIPRYDGNRTFGALSFADAGWPGPPALEPAVALDSARSTAWRPVARRMAGRGRALSRAAGGRPAGLPGLPLFAFDRPRPVRAAPVHRAAGAGAGTLLIAQLLVGCYPARSRGSAGAPLFERAGDGREPGAHYFGLALPMAFTAAIFIAAARMSERLRARRQLTTGRRARASPRHTSCSRCADSVQPVPVWPGPAGHALRLPVALYDAMQTGWNAKVGEPVPPPARA